MEGIIMSRPKIICIVGRTASGKDSITKEAINKANQYLDDKYQMIVSYTTRARRNNEDPNAHCFITEDEFLRDYAHEPMCSYTEIDGHRYFALKRDIEEIINAGKTAVYIIDPIGLEKLKDSFDPKDIYTIYINTTRDNRLKRYMSRSDETTEDNFNKRDSAEDEQFLTFERRYIFRDIPEVDVVLDNNIRTFEQSVHVLTSILVGLDH
jgi:guanylate kinase